MTHRIVAVLGTLAFIGTCLGACGGEVVAVAPPPPPAAPAVEMNPGAFQPCHAVSECRGEPPTVIGPCSEGRKQQPRWSCTGDRCVPVSECM